MLHEYTITVEVDDNVDIDTFEITQRVDALAEALEQQLFELLPVSYPWDLTLSSNGSEINGWRFDPSDPDYDETPAREDD